MIPQSLLDRINELSRKSKIESLSEDEKEEQKALRQTYSKLFKEGFEKQLLNLKVVDTLGEDVTPEKLKKAKNKNH